MADETDEATANAYHGTIELVAAYVANSNTCLVGEELQSLIRDTFNTLYSLTAGGHPARAAEATPTSIPRSKAEIRKSIGADALISFEDGKPYQSLRRHLSTRGMTPADYRDKHGLGTDYPMVHPAYSARRSELAKRIGLGQKGRQAKAAPKSRKPKPEKAPTAE